MKCMLSILIGSASKNKHINAPNKSVNIEIIEWKQIKYDTINAKHIPIYLITFLTQFGQLGHLIFIKIILQI